MAERGKAEPFILHPPVISKPMRLFLLGWLVGGLAIIAGQIFGFKVSPAAIMDGPNFMELSFALVLAIGSALVNFSTLKWKQSSTSWKLELFGWPTLIGAWLMYTGTIFALPEPPIFSACLGFGYISACSYRLVETLRSIKTSRSQVEDMESGPS